jgi:hypothetical protein
MTALLSSGIARLLLGTVTLLLLASVGGAGVVAAPILLPLHWFAARRARKAEWWIWLVLAGATAAEGGWGLAYVAAGESGPFVWLVPLITTIGTAAAFTWSRRRWAGGPVPVP